ncbi:MAG: hypothetical protein LBI74_09470 [Synergistaceae bacterium]|jgi:hypothetical protein|nr:hypothetical protein [Synergistaceae bacterium]
MRKPYSAQTTTDLPMLLDWIKSLPGEITEHRVIPVTADWAVTALLRRLLAPGEAA